MHKNNILYTSKTKYRNHFLFLMLLILFLFSSCATVGPDYSQPEIQLPDKWNNNNISGISVNINEPVDMSEWWKNLNDPVLTDLIKEAMTSNLSLKEAIARIVESRARRGVNNADLYPSITTNASAGKSYTGGRNSERYSLGLDSSWEIDLFGGIKRSIEASDADLASTEENLHDVMVSILSEIALNYVELRTYQSRLSVAQSNIKAQEETYNIVSWRYQAGLVTALDQEKAKSNLEQTRSQIPSLRTAIDQAQNRIAVLLGCHPGSLSSKLDDIQPIPEAPTKILIGLPADLLRRRPDLRKAERDLAAQTARIGVAVSDLYPKVTLTGSIGLESVSAGDLLDYDSRTYNIGPSFSWPIFRAGAIKSNIEIQTAIKDQRLIQYKSAVLNALEDVENAISKYIHEKEKMQSLLDAVDSAENAMKLSRFQYSSGLVDFQTLLESQRTLLSLQDQLSQSEGQITMNVISLYKALGGGWNTLALSTKKQ